MAEDSQYVRAIKVRVLTFGPLTEMLGAREIEVALGEGTTVMQLTERFQLISMIESGLRVAIDGEITTNLGVPLHDAAEVAFLPPVSGG